ncbi:MAG: 1-(5-phosphoribosyl)-5-[(5-phosphoribosylamino)methylideneamino]imidazole-4-carboxamide isomerase [Chloroflexi bacterium]|nr:1-(5-phosphoribosyl)-5-[(5-phosphoribosylamino)methylideneamino]imidazole-4-carboxamide isomerase [Chloroflexota bacterium]
MLIIPGIDLKDGKCVRLYQGDYEQVTVFADDPAEVAQRWRNEGATYLHIVDLDGAKAGHLVNLTVIKRIIAEAGLPIEVGGGIRDEATINQLLDLGVDRVILGTAAVKDPFEIGRLCERYGERIVIGVDARHGLVAIEGWTETSLLTAHQLAAQLAHHGATRFIYTDITRDGTLTEPNYEAFIEFKEAAERRVIASGGVSKPEHVQRLRELGAEGVIIGKALYTGDLKLADIL